MVIIITGPTHVGKTYLSQKLLEHLKYQAVSIDHIKMGLIRAGITNISAEDDEKLTTYLWPIIAEMIKTSIENKQNLIVEGCYVPASYKESFSLDYLENIKFICLAMSTEFIKNHYDEIINNSSIIEERLDNSYLTMDLLIRDNQKYIHDFSNDNLYIINNDYNEVINKIIEEATPIN